MNSGRTIFPLWMIAVCVSCIFFTLSSTLQLHSQTWVGLNGPPKARDVRDLSVNLDGSTIYVCDKSVLFKSVNGGASWTATGSLPANEVRSPLAVVSKPSTPNTVIIGVIDNLKRSTDGGATVTNIPLPTGSEPLRLSVSAINQDQMYLGRKALGTSSSILRSANGGTDWYPPTAFPYGTNINDIAPWPSSSNEVWAVGADPSGTAEGTSLSTRGAWRSTDLGVTWTEKGRTQYNLRSVAIKSAGPIVFIGSDVTGKIFSSTNSGTSWSQTTDIGGGVTSIRSLRIRNGNEVWAATNNGIYQSTNNGGSWTQKLSGGDVDVLSYVIAPNNQSLMYVTTARSLWKSTDAGANWSEVISGLGRMPLSSAVAASNASNSDVWTTSNVYDSTGSYTGTTQSWSNAEISGFYGEHIMRSSAGLLYWAGLQPPEKGALYTTNGAAYNLLYQTAQASGNIFYGSMVDPQDATKLYLWGKDGSSNFYRIQNYGAGSKDAFTVGGTTYTVNDVVAYSGSGPFYYGLNNNGGVWKCASGPCTGTQTGLNNMTVKSLALRPGVANTLYAAGIGGLKQSTDGGTSWYLRYSTDLDRVVMSPGYASSKNILILTADGEKVLYSSTSGVSWTEVQGNLPKPIREIRGMGGTPPVLYVSTDQGVYRYFGVQSGPTLTAPADQASVGAVPTLTWSGVSGATEYHLVVATDASFTNVVLDQMLTTTSVTPTSLATPGTFYWKVAAGNFAGGVYSAARSFSTQAQGTITLTASTFFGTDNKWHPRLSWTHSGQGASPVFYIYRYSCTYGQPDCGVWPYPFFLSTTGTGYDDYAVEVAVKGQTPDVTYYYQVRSAGISNKVTRAAVDGPERQAFVPDRTPRETRLYPNYPNPFNPTTTFRYDLATNTQVTLKIYNVLGEEVAILVDDYQEAGYQSFEFDASRLPSGVYFYRFSAGLYQNVSKMVLIR